MFDRHAHTRRAAEPEFRAGAGKNPRSISFRVQKPGLNTKPYWFVLLGAAMIFMGFGIVGEGESTGTGVFFMLGGLAVCWVCVFIAPLHNPGNFTVSVTPETVHLNGHAYPRATVGYPSLREIEPDNPQSPHRDHEIVFPLADDWISTGALLVNPKTIDEKTRLHRKIHNWFRETEIEALTGMSPEPAAAHAPGRNAVQAPPQRRRPGRL